MVASRARNYVELKYYAEIPKLQARLREYDRDTLALAGAVLQAYEPSASGALTRTAAQAAYQRAFPDRATRPMPVAAAVEQLGVDAYPPTPFQMMYSLHTRRQAVQHALDTPPITKRLRTFSDQQFWKAFREVGYRISVNTDGRYLARGPKAGVTTEAGMDWDGYAKSYHHPMQVFTYLITIPKDWGSRVRLQGLAVVDGLLTLDATRLDAKLPAGQALYAATWIEQGRGVSLRAGTGFLAYDQQARTGYHADSPEKAVRGLARKLLPPEITEARQAQRDARTALAYQRFDAIRDKIGRADLGALVEKCLEMNPDLEITLRDAKNVGSCTPGIESWCHQTGLERALAAGKAPLAEVFAAYQRVPATEAHATLIHAMRTDRAVQRALIAEARQPAKAEAPVGGAVKFQPLVSRVRPTAQPDRPAPTVQADPTPPPRSHQR